MLNVLMNVVVVKNDSKPQIHIKVHPKQLNVTKSAEQLYIMAQHPGKTYVWCVSKLCVVCMQFCVVCVCTFVLCVYAQFLGACMQFLFCCVCVMCMQFLLFTLLNVF